MAATLAPIPVRSAISQFPLTELADRLAFVPWVGGPTDPGEVARGLTGPSLLE